MDFLHLHPWWGCGVTRLVSDEFHCKKLNVYLKKKTSVFIGTWYTPIFKSTSVKNVSCM